MDKIKKLIIFVAIIILVLIGIIILLLKNNSTKPTNQVQNNQSSEDYGEDDGKEYELKKKFAKVKEEDVYFTVKNMLNSYVGYLESINMDVKVDKGRMEISENELKKSMYELGIKAVNQIFDEQYIKECGIDESKIKSFAEKYKNTNKNEKYAIEITEMYSADMEKGDVVLVYSKVNNVDFTYMIKVDWTTNLYSMFWNDYLEKNNYTKLRTENINIPDGINKNEYNSFTTVNPEQSYICLQYFDDLKNAIKNNPNKLYNMLDEEYRKKRFPNNDIFRLYINDISGTAEKMIAKKFKFEDNEIIIVDNFNNVYTIKISGIMEYKVLLDNYTIITEEMKNSYMKSNEQEKVYSNIDQIFQMANAKDYNGIYNKLNISFRNNNYKDFNLFREYIKQKFYEYSKVEKISSFDKNGEYYVATVVFYNGDDSKSTKKTMKIIMKLGDETNFEFSFTL